MKKPLLLLTLFIFALCYSGCGDDPDNTRDNFEISLLSGNDFTNTEKQYELNIKSSASWELSLPVDWAKLDVVRGEGDKTLYMTLSENFGKERTATITGKAGKTEKTFTFTQKGSRTSGLSQSKIEFDAAGGTVELSIATQLSWEIRNTGDVPWITFDKIKGTEGGIIKLTAAKLNERIVRGPVDLKILIGNETRVLELSQMPPNKDPNDFSLTSLQDANVEFTQGTALNFTWAPSTDPDGDAVTYDLLISKTGNTAIAKDWETLLTGYPGTSYTLPDSRLGWDTYYWRVIAKDKFYGVKESTVGRVNIDYKHRDGQVNVLHENTVPGCAPVQVVIIGDGYTKSDYNYNGSFDKHVKSVLEAMWATEPYKSYKNYFKIVSIVAYSNDQGVSIAADFTSGAKMKKQERDCRFGSECVGGNSTIINSNATAVRQFICTQLGIPYDLSQNSEENKLAVFMLINVDAWAGSCTTWSSGTTGQVLGYSLAKSAADYNLGKRMMHEGGGHGIPKLSDEYINNTGQSVPEADKTTLATRRNGDPWVYRANVDITNNRDEVHWKHYFDIPGYEKVGFYEGNMLYTYGAWRAEDKSIMQGSSTNAGFNAPSREAIVRRIMFLAGQPFDFEDYLAKDKPDFYVNPTRAPYYIDPNIKETPPEIIDVTTGRRIE